MIDFTLHNGRRNDYTLQGWEKLLEKKTEENNTMCLSKVYVKDKTNDSVVADEAARIIETEDGVEVQTLFGESKTIEGCSIKEVDLLKNCVILTRRGSGK